MANIKGAKKRILTNQKARTANKMRKTAMRNAIKKVDEAVVAKNKEAAIIAMNDAAKKLDKAKSKGIVHANYVARQKSNLMKKINTI